MRAYHCIGA